MGTAMLLGPAAPGRAAPGRGAAATPAPLGANYRLPTTLFLTSSFFSSVSTVGAQYVLAGSGLVACGGAGQGVALPCRVQPGTDARQGRGGRCHSIIGAAGCRQDGVPEHQCWAVCAP